MLGNAWKSHRTHVFMAYRENHTVEIVECREQMRLSWVQPLNTLRILMKVYCSPCKQKLDNHVA